MEKPKEIENFDCSPHVELPGKGGSVVNVTVDGSWMGELPPIRVYTKAQIVLLFEWLFEEIKHGDQEHQDWLEAKIKDFVANKLK